MRPRELGQPAAEEVDVDRGDVVHAASAREEPSAAASSPVKPSPTPRAVADEVAPSVVPASKPVASASAPAPTTAPDGGWVKPAWAIPDDEPRRVPVDDARDAGK